MKKSTDSSSNSTNSGSSYVTDRRKEWEEKRKLEKEKEIEEQKRILREMEEEKNRKITKFLNEYSPSRIEAELNEYIIDQPNLTKAVSDFLYYQALRYKFPDLPSRPLLICGPSGSGKTEVWRVAKKLYSQFFNCIIISACSITSDGWAGSNKLANYLTPHASHSILIFDEADKLFSPRYSIGGVNTSADIQSEFLKFIEEKEYTIRGKNEIDFVIKNLGVVFVGAFERIREAKTQPVGQSIGFGSQPTEQPPYQGIVTDDLLEYGVISELVGRIATICNTKPITREQCLGIILNSKSRLTVITELLAEHGIDAWKELPDERIIQIIEESDFETFGVRGVLSKIETIMLDSIHEHGLVQAPENASEKPETRDNEITLI